MSCDLKCDPTLPTDDNMSCYDCRIAYLEAELLESQFSCEILYSERNIAISKLRDIAKRLTYFTEDLEEDEWIKRYSPIFDYSGDDQEYSVVRVKRDKR